ncbi:hypothetical protein AVEN_152189-1 [Araneus ventricosus]|uniref:Uncharacterized protein n=1 Tax=Araneus ventricosus TaxID=182803 RepID=A0A4Y2HL63_ARAVE|nr:hypothetical protein AVEN_152189-1 [Araneus ventricosus]
MTAGYNLDKKSTDGEAPMHMSVDMELNDIVTALLEKGANGQIQNNAGKTHMQIAVEKGNLNIIRQLTDADYDDRTAYYDEELN